MFLTDCGNSEEILFLYLIGHFILGNKVMFWHHFTTDLCLLKMCPRPQWIPESGSGSSKAAICAHSYYYYYY